MNFNDNEKKLIFEILTSYIQKLEKEIKRVKDILEKLGKGE